MYLFVFVDELIGKKKQRAPVKKTLAIGKLKYNKVSGLYNYMSSMYLYGNAWLSYTNITSNIDILYTFINWFDTLAVIVFLDNKISCTTRTCKW